MITSNEIIRSVYGSWEVFLDRPGATRHFDTDYAGFWRSFQAIVLVAPFYAVSVMVAYWTLVERVPEAAFIDAGAYAWARAVTLVLDWVALPIVLALAAGALDIKRTYASYIVVRNWSTVLVVVPYAAIALLELMIGTTGFSLILTLLALAAVIRLAYLVARRAMDAGVGLAVGIVVLDFLLSLFLRTGTNLLFGLPPAA